MEDIKILELFHLRNERALAETDVKYGRRCRSIAFDILHNREDTEECVDDTYLALWNNIPPDCPNNFSAYIYRILRNLSLNKLQQRRAKKRGGGELELAIDELSQLIPASGTPQQTLEARELARAIDRFLATLSRDDRLIFLARYWLILSTETAARRLGFSGSKVRTSLHRSRKKLHKYLSEEGYI